MTHHLSGHTIKRATFPRQGPGTVRCGNCRVTVTAWPRDGYPERWQPVEAAWAEHRASQRPRPVLRTPGKRTPEAEDRAVERAQAAWLRKQYELA